MMNYPFYQIQLWILQVREPMHKKKTQIIPIPNIHPHYYSLKWGHNNTNNNLE